MRAAIGWFLAVGLGMTGCGLPAGTTVKPDPDRQGVQPETAQRSVAYLGRGMGRSGFPNVGMGGDSMGRRPPRVDGRRPPFIGGRRPPYLPGRGPDYIPGGSYLPPVSYYPPEVPVMRAAPPPAMSASPYGSSEETRQAAWQNWWRNTPEGRKDYWERVLRSDPFGGKSGMEDPEAAGISYATSPTGRRVTPPTTGWPPVP